MNVMVVGCVSGFKMKLFLRLLCFAVERHELREQTQHTQSEVFETGYYRVVR